MIRELELSFLHVYRYVYVCVGRCGCDCGDGGGDDVFFSVCRFGLVISISTLTLILAGIMNVRVCVNCYLGDGNDDPSCS